MCLVGRDDRATASNAASAEDESGHMGIFDKAKDALGDNPDQVDGGIDRAADFVDDRTRGAHTDQISSGADLAKDRVADYLGSPDEAESTSNPTPSAPPAGSPEPPD
jgi:MT0933-like antitoxin protein